MKANLRSERGEWKLIKIAQENSAYVLNLTQRASLLTQLKPHSYRQAIGPQNWVSELESQ
jgi:hypothetical protein